MLVNGHRPPATDLHFRYNETKHDRTYQPANCRLDRSRFRLKEKPATGYKNQSHGINADHRLKEKHAPGYKNESHGINAGHRLTEKPATGYKNEPHGLKADHRLQI